MSKKVIMMNEYKSQLVSELKLEGNKYIINILHPNTKEVLETKKIKKQDINAVFQIAQKMKDKLKDTVETKKQEPMSLAEIKKRANA